METLRKVLKKKKGVKYLGKHDAPNRLKKLGIKKRYIDKHSKASVLEKNAAASDVLKKGEEESRTDADTRTLPVSDLTVEEPAAVTAAAKSVATEEPTEETAAAEAAVTEEPAEETSAAEAAVAKEPAEEAAVTEEPAEETSAVGAAVLEEPAEETSAAEAAVTEEPAEETVAAEAAVTEEPAEETVAAEPATTEQAAEVSHAPGTAGLRSGRVQKRRTGRILLILVIILAVFGAGGFVLNQVVLNANTFQSGSSINGIDVSGLTQAKAVEKLTDQWNKKTLTITEKDSKIGTIRNFDLEYNIDQQVKECLHPSFFRKLLRTVRPSKRSYSIAMTAKESSKSFNRQFRRLSFVKNNKYTTKTRNAYVDLNSSDFKIIKEVYGDNLDKSKLKKALLSAIARNKMKFSYTAADYYEKPTVLSDSETLKERQAYAEKYLTKKITVTGAGKKYTIKPAQLDKMISVSKSGEITVDEKAVKTFVKSIADRFTTVGMTRHLKLKGGKVTISGGNYGNTLNITKETTRLSRVLAEGKDATTEAVFSMTGYGSSTSVTDDIGDFYVEVSISKQHVWCVKDGKTVVSADVVTGNVKEGNGTPEGVFSLMYKQSPSTLEGRNNDGSSYKTPVKYWMPFYAGCGFHDAKWRDSFGGSIYLRNGSHGCVNMPPAKAAKLYSYVEAGMPVIVHP
ncbi:L,D-transpeptidase family protein [Hornefia butyriciproducens]|uniref:L,D-transpeptidase family protein n=1 Tax=Hornefia butyriciproducens TaxID=2652293 RepID=UPI0023EF7367|nr:L,D-transpeptidase family protein [Hornefia butyriciproducens]MDD6299730.1 peptidoglycan binding domain-containing protein [Hornefia butyriciproducens]